MAVCRRRRCQWDRQLGWTLIESPSRIIDIKIKNISQGSLRQHKHYVQFTVGGDTQETGKSDMSADPVWSETLSLCVLLFSIYVVLEFLLSPSNTSQPSNLICQVYKIPRRIGRALHHGNELIGIMKEEIALLLKGASSKGLSLSSHCRLSFSNFLSILLEIIQSLNKPSDPGLPLGNTTIQFSISMLEHTFPVLNPIVRILCFLIKTI